MYNQLTLLQMKVVTAIWGKCLFQESALEKKSGWVILE